MSNIKTIKDYYKLREDFAKETGLDSNKSPHRYSDWLEERIVKNHSDLSNVSNGFIVGVAVTLANKYTGDENDPVYQDIRNDSIKAIKAFLNKINSDR